MERSKSALAGLQWLEGLAYALILCEEEAKHQDTRDYALALRSEILALLLLRGAKRLVEAPICHLQKRSGCVCGYGLMPTFCTLP